jgi:hypothetical protein
VDLPLMLERSIIHSDCARVTVNLFVRAWIWHLRARPEAQWRRQEISKKQRRSERLQVAMPILTLVLCPTNN